MVRIVYHSYSVVCGPAAKMCVGRIPTDPLNLALLYQILLFLFYVRSILLLNYYIDTADSL